MKEANLASIISDPSYHDFLSDIKRRYISAEKAQSSDKVDFVNVKNKTET